MVLKINKSISLKIFTILLCLFLTVSPFFQIKKVKANPLVPLAVVGALIASFKVGGYIRDAVLSPEQIEQTNEKITANLQTAFPDPADYNHQMNVLQNLNQKLLNGEEVDWSKYSGKALYAVLKGVVDVVWPYTADNISDVPADYYLVGISNNVALYFKNGVSSKGWDLAKDFNETNAYNDIYSVPERAPYGGGYYSFFEAHYCSSGSRITDLYGYANSSTNGYSIQISKSNIFYKKEIIRILCPWRMESANVQQVPNVTGKTANKVKLPTRLPQTVINNITNYIDGSSENLIVAPTAEELPQLPEGYNPVTDDLPDLPGYVDVTPDQEPTIDPEPTPTPPDPTPTPPEYDGSGWVNPIGNFLAGLLEFLKTAFVPTQSLDFSPLQNMESGTFGAKFPFSLPSDFGKILGVIQADSITPKFDASIPLSKVGYQDIPMEIDLEPYSNIAGICKSGFVILFCIGLFFLTRRFMSPGG